MSGRAGVWLVGAAVVLAVAFALVSGSGAPPPLGRGSVAPDFDLPRLRGDGALGLGDLRGKVVLVNFWATWCQPCEDEMPAMERLYDRLDRDGFELVAVSVDEDEAAVRAFRERLALSFPILLDSDKRVSLAYQTFRYPESFLIDRRGVVVERYIGPKEWDSEAYVARIRRLLEDGTAG